MNNILKLYLLSIAIIEEIDHLEGNPTVYRKKLKTKVLQCKEGLEYFAEAVYEDACNFAEVDEAFHELQTSFLTHIDNFKIV